MRFRGVLVLLIAVVLVVLGILLFRGGGSKQPAKEPKKLPEYANTAATVSFTYDGIINGDDVHRSIRITVSRSQRLLEVIQGYSNNVIQSNSFYNTEDAYRVFLSALDNAGFSKMRKNKSTTKAGVCPLGNRFVFELAGTGSAETDQRTWSATCSNGTFGGNRTTVQTLFQRQITNYAELTKTINLN